MTAISLARTYLRFFRVDSASALMTYVLLGFLLAGGAFLSLATLQWLLFGLICHMWGFADNNIQDVDADAEDENKRSFPLGREISLGRAKEARLILFVLMFANFLLLARTLGALLLFTVSVGAGLLYNRYCKRTVFAPALFAVSSGSLALVSYYATRINFAIPILLLTGIAVLESLFQNGVSTSLKDVDADKSNLMRMLGVRVGDGFLRVPRRAKLLAYAVKLGVMVPAAFLLASAGYLSVIIAIPLAVISVIFVIPIVADREWSQRARMMLMAACSQLAVFYAVLAIFAFQLEPTSVVFIAVFPIAWYATVKKAVWGSVLELRA